ncbi:hypothetical protein LCGC14_1915810, partial [marine sediment metagenome]
VLYCAKIRLQRKWDENELAKMVLTVYDSLTHEVKIEDTNRAIAVIHKEMTRPLPGITVGLPVEIKVGPSLGKLKKLSTEEVNEIVKEYT